ncbi:MAG: hypothetical protein VR70_00525 [Rhodospirillaceae bacterium BRH_c57]|nr:MAG: hypothetical protein VR70_00525 [Rhodospirillaceae bacterium BRH_c57]
MGQVLHATPTFVSSYQYGHIVVDGQDFGSDVIITPGHVTALWSDGRGHVLRPTDLGRVWCEAPAILVIGTGFYGCMAVPEETVTCVREHGVVLHIAPTSEAVNAYNSFAAQSGRRVVAALHVTC